MCTTQIFLKPKPIFFSETETKTFSETYFFQNQYIFLTKFSETKTEIFFLNQIFRNRNPQKLANVSKLKCQSLIQSGFINVPLEFQPFRVNLCNLHLVNRLIVCHFGTTKGGKKRGTLCGRGKHLVREELKKSK